MTRILVSTLLLFDVCTAYAVGQSNPQLAVGQLPGDGVWVQDGIGGRFARATVWFGPQFLGSGDAYQKRAKEFAGWKRRELRIAVMNALKKLSEKSNDAAKKHLDKLLAANDISNLERHWIINGFSCNVTPAGLKALEKIPGVRAIFKARPVVRAKVGQRQPEFFEKSDPEPLAAKRYKHPWYTRYLMADQVWNKLDIAGQGTLNVIHDFNFVFSPNLTANIYHNAGEKPGNGKDDDGNGLIDDVHGFNFLTNSALLTLQPVPLQGVNPRAMHGFMCAAIICGDGAKDHPMAFGLAPRGRWAGVIAGNRIEAAVEWAVEQGADTYSMSFSMPNLGEYRSHWRKMMEHGSFCGICFTSGAGNFAQSAEIPVQMRVPEDIPDAVFAATGVQRNFSRTPFSSKGPVEWKTHFYNEGRVNRPDVCAFNMGLPLLKQDGTVVSALINGNSFAGPMTAGSLALLLSADPDLLPWHAREILTSTTTDVAEKGYDYETGHGLINTYRAVKEVLRRKALREKKDAKRYMGREPGDELDIVAKKKALQSVFKVAQVQPNSQADKLGVKTGDIIISYNGIDAHSRADMMKAKKAAENLKQIAVVIERAGKRMTLQFEAGALGVVPAVTFREPEFE